MKYAVKYKVSAITGDKQNVGQTKIVLAAQNDPKNAAEGALLVGVIPFVELTVLMDENKTREALKGMEFITANFSAS